LLARFCAQACNALGPARFTLYISLGPAFGLPFHSLEREPVAQKLGEVSPKRGPPQLLQGVGSFTRCPALSTQVAELSERDYFRDLCILEMISRVCKRVFRAILRETGEWDLAPAIAHYLNCVVGKAPGPGEINPITPEKPEEGSKGDEAEVKEPGTPTKSEEKKKGKGKKEEKVGESAGTAEEAEKAPEAGKEEVDPLLLDFRPVYMKVTGESIWGDIEEGVWLKYKAQLPEGTRERVRKLSLLRNLCQKVSGARCVGLQRSGITNCSF
jgi:hypothetical protein